MAVVTFNHQTARVVTAAPTKEEVYQGVPDGLRLKDFIEYSEYQDFSHNELSVLENYPADILQMLHVGGGNNQVASFWGTYKNPNDADEMYNYFDLKTKQNLSAWIYLGDTYHLYSDNFPSGTTIDKVYDEGNKTNQTADGMAFVLQNDARGKSAISGAVSEPFGSTFKTANGQTLGVWGAATQNQNALTTAYTNLNAGAIQNSYAIEFDTVHNYKKGGILNSIDDMFDNVNGGTPYDIKGQHIAYGYPGESSFYQGYSSSRYTNYALKHSTGVHTNLQLSGYEDNYQDIDHAWKHFTFSYTPPADGESIGTASFYFNDKNYDGTNKPFNQLEGSTVKIDTAKIIKDTGTTKVRWGFTAATGSQFSTPRDYAVVMQQMPNTANLEATTALYDLSQYDTNGEKGRQISDLDHAAGYNADRPDSYKNFLNNAKYNVANGDDLRFEYNLKYIAGFAGTEEINTEIKLPQNIDFKPGINGDLADDSIGQIIYKGDSSTADHFVEIPASAIETSDGVRILNLKLENMHTIDQTVSIQLFGQAVAETTPVKVDAQHTSYRSAYYIDDVMSPIFIINDKLKIETDKLEQTIKYKDDAQINGTISYENGSVFDSKGIKIHTNVNGTDMPVGDAEAISGDKTGSYQMIFDAVANAGSLLKNGKNTITVYVTDSLNRVSNELEYIVNVDGKQLLLEKSSSTPTEPITGYTGTDLTLDMLAKYQDASDLTLNGKILHVQLDDQAATEQTLTDGSVAAEQALSHTIPAHTFKAGSHTVTYWLTDEENGITSNKVTFALNYQQRELVAVADKNDVEISVTDNKKVQLHGTVAYDNKSNFNDKNNLAAHIKLTNADGTVAEMTGTDFVVFDAADNSAEFTITLAPIGYEYTHGNTAYQQSFADYLKGASGLKVGLNKVEVYITDGAATASNTVNYEIDVPDIQPSISQTDPKVIGIQSLTLQFPMEFTYPDIASGKYYLNHADLLTNVTEVDGQAYEQRSKTRRPYTEVVTPYALNPISDWIEALSEGDHTIKLNLVDAYLRETNSLEYDVTILPKGAMLEVGDYEFNDIDPKKLNNKEDLDLVKRRGDWTIKVSSYNTKWKLTAQSDTLKRQTTAGDYSEPSELSLSFVKDGNEMDLRQPQEIASQDVKTETAITKDYGNWDDPDEGILLRTNGVPRSGSHRGQMVWDLDDSV